MIRPLGEEVFDLAKMDAASNALIDASRPFSSINAMVTEMTFFSHAFMGIKLHHSEGTGLKAGFTTGAGFRIDKDDPVSPLLDGMRGTRLFTRGVGTLEAASRKKGQPEPPIDFLNPLCFDLDPARSFRWVILLLAGQLAGVAPPTDLLIDDHRQSFGHLLSYLPF
jgi:hypothetical protein